MAFTLLSPPLSFPTSYPSTTVNGCTAAGRIGNGWSRVSLTRTFVAKASKEDDENSSFNPFGFVTDNPSSRSAIQLPEVPAEDGNVGQMLYRIEDKGRDYGSYIKSGGFRWFVRETGSSDVRLGPRGTVVFLHGAPTQSYSYRVVMSQMAEAGFHCLAPDWIGFGFSDKPQAGYGFDYTEKEYHEQLDKLLDVLEVKSSFTLVVQVDPK